MNDEFITRGIENDRYLKATRLVNRFETEVEGKLKDVTDDFISNTEDLFEDGVDKDFNMTGSAGAVIAHGRVNTDMKRFYAGEDGADTLTLNITLRWLDPAEYDYPDADGALCVTGYKINSAASENHDRIKRQMRDDDSDVRHCRDAYDNAPGM